MFVTDRHWFFSLILCHSESAMQYNSFFAVMASNLSRCFSYDLQLNTTLLDSVNRCKHIGVDASQTDGDFWLESFDRWLQDPHILEGVVVSELVDEGQMLLVV